MSLDLVIVTCNSYIKEVLVPRLLTTHIIFSFSHSHGTVPDQEDVWEAADLVQHGGGGILVKRLYARKNLRMDKFC